MRLLCLPYFQETGGTHRFSGRGLKKSHSTPKSKKRRKRSSAGKRGRKP